jgi:GGDEF domain-containing protein
METIHQVDLDDFIDVCHHLRDGQESEMIVRMRRADNSYRWILLHIARYRLKLLNVVTDYYEIYATDILVLKQRYRALEALVKSSQPSSSVLHEDFMCTKEEAIAYCHELMKSEENEFSMLLIEVDGLDEYRSQYGDAFAQQLVDTAIDTTRDILDNRGVICPHEDNTFSVVVRGINQEINLRSFVEALRNRITWNELVRNNVEQVTLSIGISRYPQNGNDYDIALKKLYRALDICHTRGISKYIIYREHLHGEIQ